MENQFAFEPDGLIVEKDEVAPTRTVVAGMAFVEFMSAKGGICCGYDLQNHHHTLADAEACAIIALQIL